jgi:hypothetical protein
MEVRSVCLALSQSLLIQVCHGYGLGTSRYGRGYLGRAGRVLNECSRQHRHRTSTGGRNPVRVFILIPVFCPNSDSLPSRNRRPDRRRRCRSPYGTPAPWPNAPNHGAPFAHFWHRRFVAAGSPAVPWGDAPRYSADDAPSTVGPDDQSVKPPRSSCSTQTYKVPSEGGGEASIKMVRCNGQ